MSVFSSSICYSIIIGSNPKLRTVALMTWLINHQPRWISRFRYAPLEMTSWEEAKTKAPPVVIPTDHRE